MRPAFVKRAREVEQRLGAADTSYAVVSTTDPTVVENSQFFIDGLQERDRAPGLLLVNRLPPTLRLLPGGSGSGLEVALDLDRSDDVIADPSLAAAVGALAERARSARLPELARSLPTGAVPLTADDLTDLDDLDRLLDGP